MHDAMIAEEELRGQECRRYVRCPCCSQWLRCAALQQQSVPESMAVCGALTVSIADFHAAAQLPWPRVRTHALPALLLLACKLTFGRGMRTAKASVAQFLMHARAHTCTRKSQHEKKKME